ncbi:MAG: hypothetical protein ACE5H4_06365 [Candidatus Thorarchaeota archaeon]
MERFKVISRWDYALLVFGILYLVSGFLRGDYSPLGELSPMWDFILEHINLIALWAIGSFAVKRYTTKADRLLDESILQRKQSTQAKGTPFELPTEQLLERSDHLDDVRNNLRTGISVLLAIGIGVIIWLLGNTVLLSTQVGQGLLVAAGALIGSATFAVLVSYTDYTLHQGDNGMGEGLLPESLTEEQYGNEIKSIVHTKQEILRRMRRSIGLGLLGFLVAAIGGFFMPSITTTPPAPEAPVTMSSLTTLQTVTAISMFSFLVLLGAAIVGRHVLGVMKLKTDEE